MPYTRTALSVTERRDGIHYEYLVVEADSLRQRAIVVCGLSELQEREPARHRIYKWNRFEPRRR